MYTVELVLFETSNSMKTYPSVFRAYTGKPRPVIGLFERSNLDEASSRIPPTSQLDPCQKSVEALAPF